MTKTLLFQVTVVKEFVFPLSLLKSCGSRCDGALLCRSGAPPCKGEDGDQKEGDKDGDGFFGFHRRTFYLVSRRWTLGQNHEKTS